MALSCEQKRKLLAANLPKSQQVRKLLQDYLDRSGLRIQDFAARIGYSAITVRMFLIGAYERVAGNDANIRMAITSFIDRHPLGEAEQVAGHVYETENVRLLRKYFYEALDRQDQAVYVEGDPGTQKSFALQHLVAELNRAEISKNGHGRRAYYVYSPPGATPTKLLRRVAQSTGTITSGDADRIVRNLRFDFRDRRALLVFDEAQHLNVACLETLRELLDLKPHFGLMFAGSHQLQQFFVRNTVQLEQWQSRFHAGKRLPGMSAEEAAEICRAEIPSLGAKKIEAIVEGSYAKAMGSEGAHRYISARRLFATLRDLKAAARQKGTAIA